MTKTKDKPACHYRVALGYSHRAAGWRRREVVVLARSRREAVVKAVRELDYIYIPPASGSRPTKTDAGRYFLVLCQKKYYVCLAKSQDQARAYVHRLTNAPTVWQVWNVTAVRLSGEEEYILEESLRRKAVHSVVSEPWVCEHCSFEDFSRRPGTTGACYNCSQPPFTDEERLELHWRLSTPANVTLPLFSSS